MAPSAFFTLSGVSGISRKRTPLASAIALARAAAVGPWAASPAPRKGKPGYTQSGRVEALKRINEAIRHPSLA
jgi:hypothetical protein